MTYEEEFKIRVMGAQLITEAGILLKIPWYTIITSQQIYHRFYYRYSKFYYILINIDFVEYHFLNFILKM